MKRLCFLFALFLGFYWVGAFLAYTAYPELSNSNGDVFCIGLAYAFFCAFFFNEILYKKVKK
jgi:hypothetical protein